MARRTSRSTESSRIPTVRRASAWAAGSSESGGKDLEEWDKVALEEALRAEAWLLGRRSYEFFGVRWQSRSGELADRLNSMPKYVVSSTLEAPEWNNSTVLKGDVVTEVSKLKQELDGEIVVPASYQLGRTLIEHDLVDELRLVVFPVVLGAGERFFGETSDKNRCASSTPRQSVTASSSSPTSSSGRPSSHRARDTNPSRLAGPVAMRRRGREPPPGCPGLDPQPGSAGVRCVQACQTVRRVQDLEYVDGSDDLDVAAEVAKHPAVPSSGTYRRVDGRCSRAAA